MTKVISRYFSSAKRARMARKDLLFIERFPYAIIHLIDKAEGAADYAHLIASADLFIDADSEHYARAKTFGFSAAVGDRQGSQPACAQCRYLSSACHVGATRSG